MTVKYNKVPYFTQKVARYFGYFMVIFYVVLGLLLIFLKELFPELNQNTKVVFGVILVIYGIFRGYRVFKSVNHYENPE